MRKCDGWWDLEDDGLAVAMIVVPYWQSNIDARLVITSLVLVGRCCWHVACCGMVESGVVACSMLRGGLAMPLYIFV